MTPLQRTVARTEPQRIAVGVAQNLNFDVARMLEKLLDVEFRLAESAARFLARHRDRFQQLPGTLHHPHAAPAAAPSRLDDNGKADRFGDLKDRCGIIGQAAVRPRNAWHACCAHGAFGRHLVAHRPDGARFRADETQPCRFDLFGELGVFRKEAVAGMNGLRAADMRRKQDRGTVQIALPRRGGTDAQRLVGQPHVARVRIRFRIDRDRLEPQLTASPLDSKRNLAAVGNQYLVKHRHPTGKNGTSSQRSGDCSMDLHAWPSPDAKQRLAGFHLVTRLDENLDDGALEFGFDRVEHLHRFDRAQRLPFFDGIAYAYERRFTRRRRQMNDAEHRSADQLRLAHRGIRLWSKRRRVGRPAPLPRRGSNAAARGMSSLASDARAPMCFDKPNLLVALDQFEFGEPRFGQQVNETLNLLKIHF